MGRVQAQPVTARPVPKRHCAEGNDPLPNGTRRHVPAAMRRGGYDAAKCRFFLTTTGSTNSDPAMQIILQAAHGTGACIGSERPLTIPAIPLRTVHVTPMDRPAEHPIERPAARQLERPFWLTYAQAADRLGLSAEAVRHRARRSGWRTMPGNDGRTLVLVPDDEMADIRPRAPVHTPDRTPVRTAGHDDEIARANARADKANERADAAHALADRALAQLADAGARADRAETAVADERARADALRQQLLRTDARSDELRTERDQAHKEAKAAQERAAELQAGQELMMEMHARALAEAQDQLERVREAAERLRRAEEERRGRGLLARLRAAVRGR
jgi:hypothetical protein